MKKVIITALFIALFATSQAYARWQPKGDMYLIPKGSINIGVSSAHDVDVGNESITANPGIGAGAVFGYGMIDKLHAEVDGSLIYWVTSAPSGYDVTMYMVPILATAHYQVNKMLSGIGGIGLTYWYYDLSYEYYNGFTNVSVHDDYSALKLTYCIGAEFNFNRFIIRSKIMYVSPVDNDASLSVSAEFGYKFDIKR